MLSSKIVRLGARSHVKTTAESTHGFDPPLERHSRAGVTERHVRSSRTKEKPSRRADFRSAIDSALGAFLTCSFILNGLEMERSKSYLRPLPVLKFYDLRQRAHEEVRA